MSEKRPELHNSDLFLKPEFPEPNQEELIDTFKNSILKKGPSLGENNHIKPLYTSDFYNAYFNKAVTLYTDSPISAELKVRNKRLENASQKSRSRIDKLKQETSKGQGKFPLNELGSSFTWYDKTQESQNKYYLGSKSRFAENAERFTSNKKSTSQNYSQAFLSLRSSKHTSASLDVVVDPVQTENKALQKQSFLQKPLFTKQIVRSKQSTNELGYRSNLLKALPSIIRSGISREFLLVTINLVLLSILAIIQRNNYGLCKWFPFATNTVLVKSFGPTKGSSPIISKGSHLFCASKIPNISSSSQNKVLRHQVAQNVKQSSWQYFNQIKPGYLSFVLQHKVFTVPWQDQKQEKFVGVFLGEANLNSCVIDGIDRSSKYKQIKLVNGEENLLLSLPHRPGTGQVSDMFSSFTKKNLNKDLIVQSTAEKNPSFQIEGKNPLLPFSVLPPAKFADCVIKPWYCMKAYNTSNDNIVATRVQKRVNNGTFYKNPKIQGFEYYMPYYTSQERLFVESDTIPSKRGAIYYQTVKKLNTFYSPKQSRTKTTACNKKTLFFVQRKKTPQNYGSAQAKFQSSEPNYGCSSISTSQSILKRCFYKSGLFVISPSKKRNSFKISKEERNYLTRSPYIKNVRQCLRGVTETKNHTINKTHDQGQAFTQTHHSRTIPEVNVKSSCIPGDYINLALYKNLDTSYLELNVLQKLYKNFEVFAKDGLNALKIGKYSPVFTKSINSSKPHGEQNNCSIRKVIFPSTFAWSKYHLSKAKPNAFAQVKSSVSIFNFIPDYLVKNTSVSGYKFPELKKKEIVYLFRQRAILSFYLYFNTENKKKVFEKNHIKTPLFFRGAFVCSNKNKVFVKTINNQITIPFLHTFQSYDLIDQILSAQGNEFLNEAFTKTEPKLCFDKTTKNVVFVCQDQKSLLQQSDNKVINKASETFGMCPNLFHKPDPSMTDLKMQYTQVNLDEIENVKDIFSQMGRDYEEYLRQPKDSLPALIISPSLEDDREIEEEGIQIFRKREIKNTRNARNTNGELDESQTFTENVFQEKNGDSNLNNTSFSTTQELNKSEKIESKSEIQNRQTLVKNALRQAQEEIDNIAKKEEKGGDKEKQVIPPLTRLEALYTIRNREKKHEQAKDLTSRSKKTTSYLRLRASKNSFNILPRLGLGNKKARFNDLVSQNKQLRWLSESTKNFVFALPFFEELFLYSDKPHNADLKKASVLGFTKTEFLLKHNWISTPWLFSKLGDSSICTDRKHSFFGEMSLFPKKLTAQEQKQIFQQKANPLLKVNTKNMQEENRVFLNHVPSLFSEKVSNSEQGKIVNLDIPQPPRFQIGTRLLPETMGLEGKALFKSLPSPIYFYNNLSQNKACQASAPKIKGTPLGSPVYHRVWQPKRMEPSTFRVSSRSQSTPVLPIITQKDWKNIINWQVKKHFFEEDRRLLALSLNKNKNLKIKKVNIYLPWISIKKAENIVNNQALSLQMESILYKNKVFVRSKQSSKEQGSGKELGSFASQKDKGFLQKSSNVLTEARGFVENKAKQNKNFVFVKQSTQLHGKTSNYWRLPVQQTLSTITWPVKKQERKFLNQRGGLGKVNKSQVKIPQKELGIGKKVCNESILFESVTTYSWLFIYTFVFVLMFKQLFNFVYKVGFKDFFIKFLNSDFGRTVTSEEFRYSIQNLPLTESYMPKTRLQELLGLEKNKMQLLEVVWFLRNNCQGRNGPRGILLVGPPGVENVSVVQAIAGEANVPIIVQSLEKIAQDNEPQRQLEQLYMRAHKKAPCVLFLDQLDTIGARRDQLFTNKRDAHSLNSSMTSISDQKDYNINGVQNSVNSGNKLNVVLRLLTILDGITQSSGVVTVATAQDVTKLDPALLRPKRFDRRIYLSLPNQQDRVNLFKMQTRSIGHVKEMPWDYFGLQTENMSTADIRSAINYSLFRAVLRNSAHTVETLEYGIDCVKSLTNKRLDKK